LAAHPAVAEVAVVGVPDPAAGEIACAVLRCRAEARPPTLGEVGAFLTARGLSRRKLPERLELVADFPRTATGKLVNRARRARLGGRGWRPIPAARAAWSPGRPRAAVRGPGAPSRSAARGWWLSRGARRCCRSWRAPVRRTRPPRAIWPATSATEPSPSTW